MNELPTPAEMHEMVRPLEDVDRKVLGGLVALWMSDPSKMRDKEWTSTCFVHVATVAHGFDENGAATSDDVDVIQKYANDRMATVLRVGFALFVRVANDMQEREGGFIFENAQESVRTYLEPAPDSD